MEKEIFLVSWIVFLFALPVFGMTAPSEYALPVIRLKTLQYIDRQGIGIEAFRMLIPSDWSFEGGVHWIMDNPAMPAVVAFRVSNPKGLEELEVFPNQMFFWTSNQTLLSMFPIGSKYIGAEVHPPLGAVEFLQNVLIPRFRGGVPNLRIVETEKLPELARQLGAGKPQPGVSVSADGGKVKIEYQRSGRWIEEVIFAVVESFTFPIQTIYGPIANMNWTGEYLFSFKAEKGKLSASSRIFQTMVNSFQLNPLWFSKYSQLVEYLIRSQIQKIETMGQISRIISQTSNEISDMMMESYQNRQSVYDRLSEQFSQVIRGVEEYYNPIDQRTVELPSGYTNAWVNSLGEYILSDDPNFNPNVGSNLNWQKIERRR